MKRDEKQGKRENDARRNSVSERNGFVYLVEQSEVRKQRVEIFALL